MRQAPFTLKVPFENQLIGGDSRISNQWGYFFRMVRDLLFSLGRENYFELVNNQATPADIEGLQFDSAKVGAAYVDYLIQRVTKNTNAVELLETGFLSFVYKPTSLDWDLTVTTLGPHDAGITFSITAAGKAQYISTNELGTPYISRIIWRARTFAAKNTDYSEAG